GGRDSGPNLACQCAPSCLLQRISSPTGKNKTTATAASSTASTPPTIRSTSSVAPNTTVTAALPPGQWFPLFLPHAAAAVPPSLQGQIPAGRYRSPGTQPACRAGPAGQPLQSGRDPAVLKRWRTNPHRAPVQ